MTDRPLRVLIIGAGVGGLALGQALIAAGGIDVRIHERNADARHLARRLPPQHQP